MIVLEKRIDLAFQQGVRRRQLFGEVQQMGGGRQDTSAYIRRLAKP
ncbi:MAG: hypothetical protein HC779_08175 [Phyllobacteriaceae bacterium]|nr:hypothetical protein [Phyllobacteriaceae bacterium]